ncbi:uncharacterized protein LOC122463838 [Chelonia mydas]|uniref:uncharacterized protein LOC122463838 n=1 Tax=Chelonia mydas TaxID=8469 RepID=UPI001CA944E2|nr:uncharacterized protein LOC122463838 [Chelonia mydas]
MFSAGRGWISFSPSTRRCMESTGVDSALGSSGLRMPCGALGGSCLRPGPWTLCFAVARQSCNDQTSPAAERKETAWSSGAGSQSAPWPHVQHPASPPRCIVGSFCLLWQHWGLAGGGGARRAHGLVWDCRILRARGQYLLPGTQGPMLLQADTWLLPWELCSGPGRRRIRTRPPVAGAVDPALQGGLLMGLGLRARAGRHVGERAADVFVLTAATADRLGGVTGCAWQRGGSVAPGQTWGLKRAGGSGVQYSCCLSAQSPAARQGGYTLELVPVMGPGADNKGAGRQVLAQKPQEKGALCARIPADLAPEQTTEAVRASGQGTAWTPGWSHIERVSACPSGRLSQSLSPCSPTTWC